MAPAANTARQRRVPGSARTPADSDSDAEYQAYNGRLQEASAARIRLRKVQSTHTLLVLPASQFPTPNPTQAQQTRDKNRTALATAYDASLLQIEVRVQKAVAKHKDLR